MKLFKDVQQAREAHHLGRDQNAVHRSSLIVTRMAGAATHISFLNHFLLKRGLESVACKLSAFDAAGRVVGVKAVRIDRPIVYAFDLDALFENDDRIYEYMVEFHSSENLVVPFPAVMINHQGAAFLNVVHAFNRTLNDILEDDEVNRHTVSESSIEVDGSGRYDTFFNFATGPFAPQAPVEVRISRAGGDLAAAVDPGLGRMTNKTFYLSHLFGMGALTDDAVLKIRQPRQPLFYGRLLSGLIDTETKAFSANHSYYDNSVVPEYFENRECRRLFPYFAGFLNQIKMYPIMSPGEFEISISLYRDGVACASVSKVITSPSGDPVWFDIDQIVRDCGAADCTAFEVAAAAPEGAKIPTRVMHQLIYGIASGRSRLHSSVAVGLVNATVFKPKAKTGLCWGQVVRHADYESRLGLCFDSAAGPPEPVTVQFYSAAGFFKQSAAVLRPGEAMIFDGEDFGRPDAGLPYVWYLARSERADLSAQSFHAHRVSHHASGEHSF